MATDEPAAGPAYPFALVRAGKDLRRQFADRRHEKAFRPLRMRKQRLHFAPQRCIASARSRENGAVCRVSLQRRVTDVLDPPRSDPLNRPAFQLAQQPKLRQPPVPLDRIARDMEHAGGLLDAEPAEEAHFDDLGIFRASTAANASSAPSRSRNSTTSTGATSRASGSDTR